MLGVLNWRHHISVICICCTKRNLYTLRKSNLACLLRQSDTYKAGNIRWFTQHDKIRQHKNKTAMMYITAIAIMIGGLSYAAVPMYRIFCQATGLGGQATAGHDIDKVETMQRLPQKKLTIRFNADTASSLQWNFKPQQTEIKLSPGETALAFYVALNPTDKPIVGISTYNVIPFEAGQYFNKIQCFCFEEQRLNPHEKVDMPVFFYIDPEFTEDPKMEDVEVITLSYTFFEAKEGMDFSFLSRQ